MRWETPAVTDPGEQRTPPPAPTGKPKGFLRVRGSQEGSLEEAATAASRWKEAPPPPPQLPPGRGARLEKGY